MFKKFAAAPALAALIAVAALGLSATDASAADERTKGTIIGGTIGLIIGGGKGAVAGAVAGNVGGAIVKDSRRDRNRNDRRK